MLTESRFLTIMMPVCTALMSATAQEPVPNMQPDSAQTEFFEEHIRPALIRYCYECHSVESGTTRGGLLVDTREGLLTGGDSGAAIAPGRPEDSLLWDAINWNSYEMPPGEKMPQEVIDHFRAWLADGAPDPRVRERVEFRSRMTADVIDAGKQHWAFQPPNRSSATGSIDSRIMSRLEAEGLEPVGPADALTFLRRLNFDLIGLPPTPEETLEFQTAWEHDPAQAVAARTDELLNRPQFGERWGRHWLDVARYADTSGNVNVVYPEAWRYRDYVIDSFNDDTPYDQFIREQIAGDLLPASSDEEWQKNLIATGYLAVGMKRHGERNPKKFMMDMVDEQIDTLTQGILGLTVACARCHDHKSDPIPTADYYSLAGIFLSTRTFYGTVWGQQNHRPSDLLLLPISDESTDSGRLSVEDIQDQISQLRREYRRMNAAARDSGERIQRDFVSMRNRIAKLEGILAGVNQDGSRKTFGMGVQDSDRMVDAAILVAGDPERPAQEVPRGFLQVLNDVTVHSVPEDSSGRRELVGWLTSADNPLTARVMVNRVWMHLFGRPIVESPNNWGPNGMPPTHPELLDHLAVRFMEQGWSIKSLIREIVLSDTYRRSSAFESNNAEADPDNRLLWRMSPRQLDAEALRDAMLTAGGMLDLSRPRSTVADWGDGRVDRGAGNRNRINELSRYRSVYLPVIRDEVHESLDLFSFPDPNMTSAGRRSSIGPTQALYLMNGEFTIQQAGAMADRLLAYSDSHSEQIRRAFLTAYGRPATETEVRAGIQFLQSVNIPALNALPSPASNRPQRKRQSGASPGTESGRPPGRTGPRQRPRPEGGGPQTPPVPSAEQLKLTLFCQALLAGADFRILN